MKITEKVLEDTISQIAGKQAIPIYKLLKGREDVNEFELTEKLKLSINEIRNILYKFDHHNLLSSKRKKDRQKGWYIYFWTLSRERLIEVTEKLMKEKLKNLNRLLDLGDEEYYSCVNKCIKFDEATALEHDYTCPECKLILDLEKSKKNKFKIKKEIVDIETRLAVKK